MWGSDPVTEALDRWQRKGLIEPDTARRLAREAQEEGARAGRRLSRYALAAAGGVVLVVAVGVLADWLWPLMEVGTRSLVLAGVGVAVHGLGRWIGFPSRWRPAGYLLQTAGLFVLLGAFVYSAEVWTPGSPAGIAVGIAALTVPLVLAPRALRDDPFMPAVHLALGFAFLAVFLHRAAGLEGDALIWSLDAVMVAVSAALVVLLVRADDREAVDRILPSALSALYTGLILILLTVLGPLEMESGAVWAVDAWLAGVAALTLWGIHGAPPRLRRPGFERHLALCIVLAVPLGFFTLLEEVEAGPEATALALGLLGGAGLAYGTRFHAGATLKVSALVVSVAAWYYGVERAGALGAVAALGLTAALLFWLSGRLDEEEDAGPGGDGPLPSGGSSP